MHEHTKQANNKIALILIDTFGHSQKTVNATRKIREVIDEALKSQAEYIRAEMVPKLEKVKSSDIRDGFNACADELIYNLDELINSFK